jgi:Ca-activated chloride channel homolog
VKPTTVALLSAAGMLLSAVSVYSITPSLRSAAASPGVTPEAVAPVDTPAVQVEASRFTAGATLQLEARLGHPRLLREEGNETFVLLEVKGDTARKASASAPVNLSVVIDRSGSMRGSRMQNAMSAAVGAVDRLHDGDVVSVVVFDTKATVIVPPTTIGPGARERVASDIRAITLGGDTCLSCGIEQAALELDRTPGQVNRMVVLSDGDANSGVRDLPGFRSIAQRARDRAITITTIGVDVEYNEKILSAISQEANGQHYFVENESALSRVFEAEAESLTRTIASAAEATIELPLGVELSRVYARSFRRVGGRVIVPLGTFAAGETKTVLMKVRVPGKVDGPLPIARVDLAFQDHVENKPARCGGTLGTVLTSSRAEPTDIDPIVGARIQRSETAAALDEANNLFLQGKADEARRRLSSQAQVLRGETAKPKAAPAANEDLQKQIAVVAEAESGFASPPPSLEPNADPAKPQESRQGKGAVKKNRKGAFDLEL